MRTEIVKFIKRAAKRLGTEGGALGLSGGVDSAVCAALICEALGPENCLGVVIPAPDSNPQDQRDADRIAACLGMRTTFHPLDLGMFNFRRYNFETEVKPILTGDLDMPLTRPMQAPFVERLRGRMWIISYYAYKHNYFQCETLNKTEWELGWFDKFGDGAGDIAPIRHLYKTQVYELAQQYVNEGKLPQVVINRAPGCGNYPMPVSDIEEAGGLSFWEVDLILQQEDSNCENLGVPADKIAWIRKLHSTSKLSREVPLRVGKTIPK